MNHSQFGLMTYRLFIGFCLTALLIVFSACKSFDKTNAEMAIKKYVHRTFYRPDTYKAVHFYTPKKMTVSTDPADRNNSSFSIDKNKIVDGWGIAVDIRAMNRNNVESSQSAAFYLNAECDSVIFSDIAPQFMNVDSMSIFGAAH
jgi:hypothetical protein